MVRADQQFSRALLLNTVKKIDPSTGKEVKKIDPSTGKETVETVMVKENTDNGLGSTFYLSVAPKNIKEETCKFEETVWMCTDVLFFVTDVQVYHFATGPDGEVFMGNAGGPFGPTGPIGPNPYLIDINAPKGINTIGSGLKTATYDIPESIPISYTSSALLSQFSSTPVNNDFMKTSKVGQIHQGREIKETYANAELDACYEATSCPCRISLSVQDRIEFREECPQSELEEIVEDIMKDVLKNENSKYIEELEKVYDSEVCGICLDDEEEIDMVYYQCGHKCAHYECGSLLKKCPMCNQYVKAICVLDTKN